MATMKQFIYLLLAEVVCVLWMLQATQQVLKPLVSLVKCLAVSN